MKKTTLASVLALTLGTGAASAATMTSATFSLLAPNGISSINDVNVTGAIGAGTFSVASPTPFKGFFWTTHDGVTFGPGTYTIDTIEGGTYTGIEVGAGQVGGHILFDWNTTRDIDVVMVWDVTDNGDGTYDYFSTDPVVAGPNAEPDGVRGVAMIDGAFPGFSANFDFTTATSPEDAVGAAVVPVPAAVWLFGSGLLSLVSVARRRKGTCYQA